MALKLNSHSSHTALETDRNDCVCLTATVVLFTAGLFGPDFSNSSLLLEIHDIVKNICSRRGVLIRLEMCRPRC